MTFVIDTRASTRPTLLVPGDYLTFLRFSEPKYTQEYEVLQAFEYTPYLTNPDDDHKSIDDLLRYLSHSKRVKLRHHPGMVTPPARQFKLDTCEGCDKFTINLGLDRVDNVKELLDDGLLNQPMKMWCVIQPSH